MKLWTIVCILSLLLIVGLRGTANAEGAAEGALSRDEAILRGLAEQQGRGKAGSGVLLIDATVLPSDSFCRQVYINFGRKVDGKPHRASVAASAKFFGKVRFDGLKAVSEGEYFVLSLVCDRGNGRTNFNGPHAKFHVRSGELINVSSLKLEYKSDGLWSKTGTAARSIQDIGPDTMVMLRDRFPKAIAKAVKRPMTIVGPAEIRMTFPSGL